MGQHRALAAAGSTAGVQDGGQVIGATAGRFVLIPKIGGTLQQRTRAVVIQREHVGRAGFEGDLADPCLLYTARCV